MPQQHGRAEDDGGWVGDARPGKLAATAKPFVNMES